MVKKGVSSRQFCASCLPCQTWEQSEILLGRIQFLFNQLHQDCLIGKVSQCNLTEEFAPVQWWRQCWCAKSDAIRLLCWCSTQVGLFFIAGQDLRDWRWWQSFYLDGRSLMHLSTLFCKFLLEHAFHLQLRLPHSPRCCYFSQHCQKTAIGVLDPHVDFFFFLSQIVATNNE